MVNHLSRHSPEFQAFAREGRRSPTADLFITPDKVWPDGQPPAADLARLFLRRKPGPVLDVRRPSDGERGHGLDHVRRRRAVRADRPRPTSHAGRARWSTVAGEFAAPRRADGPARRGRLCDQEGRHVVLHGRARDLDVPRLDRRASRTRLGLTSAARDPRRSRDARAARAARATGPTTSSSRAWCSTRSRRADRAPRGAPRLVAATDRSRCSTATTGSRCGPTSTGILDADEMRSLGATCARAPRRQRQPHPVAVACTLTASMSTSSTHLLLGARDGRRQVHHGSRDPALCPWHAAGLLRRPPRGRNDAAAVARDGRGPVDQPARLQPRRGRTRPDEARSCAGCSTSSSCGTRTTPSMARSRSRQATDGLRLSWTNGAHRATLDVDARAGTCSAGATDGGDWRQVAA